MAGVPGNGNTVSFILEDIKEYIATMEDGPQKYSLIILLSLHRRMVEIEKNPMMALGNFIQKNPKLFWFLVFFLFVLANLWFVKEFREPILASMGIHLIAPAVVP